MSSLLRPGDDWLRPSPPLAASLTLGTHRGITRSLMESQRPAFRGPSENSKNVLAIGWIEQMRRSKLRQVWKSIILSLVKGKSGSNQVHRGTTLWIQREQADGKLESLQKIPIEWVQRITPTDQSASFSIKIYDSHGVGSSDYLFSGEDQNNFVFRVYDADAYRSWITTLQTVHSYVKKGGKPTTPAPRDLLTFDDDNDNTTGQHITGDLLSMNTIPSAGPIINAFAASSSHLRKPMPQVQNTATGAQQRCLQHHGSNVQQQHMQANQKHWHPVHQNHPPQPRPTYGMPQLPHHNIPSAQNSAQQPPFGQHQSHTMHNHNMHTRTMPADIRASSTEPSVSCAHTFRGPSSMGTAPLTTNDRAGHRNQSSSTKHNKPQPVNGDFGAPRWHGSAPSHTSTSDNTSRSSSTSMMRHQVMMEWALVPPQFAQLRPVHALVQSIHTVFPPKFGLSRHDYFDKWTALSTLSISGIDKAVRKLRFFLHPDKLPRDLSTEQLYLCKLLWDVTNDAWELHKNK